MNWCSSSEDNMYFVQLPNDPMHSTTMFELRTFQRDAYDNCIWIKIPRTNNWKQYCSLYFSNGIIGIYNPETVRDGCLLRVEFEDPFDALSIETGLTYSFLNQFDLGLENCEVMKAVKNLYKRINNIRNGIREI